MELNDISVSARSLLAGSDVVDVTAKQTFKIETSPSGLEVLEVEVPEGERWHVVINLQIEKFSV